MRKFNSVELNTRFGVPIICFNKQLDYNHNLYVES